MAAPRKGQAIVKRGVASTGGKSLPQPNNDTMNYMRETFDMLAIPDSVEFDIPPLDLTTWQDPFAKQSSAIAIDSDSDTPAPPPATSGQQSRASSSSASEDKPIAQVAAKLKKQSSPPKRKKETPQTEEEGEISDVAPADTKLKSKSDAASEPRTSPKKLKPASDASPVRPQANGTSSASPQSQAKKQPLQDEPIEPSLPPHPRATYFSKAKLKVIAAECRSRGRTSKHAGDKRMRSNPSPAESKIALFELTDAFLLYVYSFWADDFLAGRLDEHGRLTKPGCRGDNWLTIFGLMHHVKGRADAAHLHLIGCLCDLVEGMILTHMQRVERRRLHSVAQQAQAQHHTQVNGHGHDGVTAGTTPGSSIPTPPSDAASASAAEINKQLQEQFLELSTGNERAFQMFRAAQDLLTLGGLRAHLPSFAAKISGADSRSTPLGLAPPDQMSEPARPWTFAFGIDTSVSYASIGQVVCFGRALLEDLAVQAGADWRPEWEPLDVPSQ